MNEFFEAPCNSIPLHGTDDEFSIHEENPHESGFICSPIQRDKHAAARQQKSTGGKGGAKQPARFVAMFP
jgi:hypothetical protein